LKLISSNNPPGLTRLDYMNLNSSNGLVFFIPKRKRMQLYVFTISIHNNRDNGRRGGGEGEK